MAESQITTNEILPNIHPGEVLKDLEEEENNHAPEFEMIKMYEYA